MTNYSASEFMKLKSNKNLRPSGKKMEKRVGKCRKCGDPSDKIVKGMCSKCYNGNKMKEKYKKRRVIF